MSENLVICSQAPYLRSCNFTVLPSQTIYTNSICYTDKTSLYSSIRIPHWTADNSFHTFNYWREHDIWRQTCSAGTSMDGNRL